MTVSEYIRKKNKIIFDVCGLTLVPEEQIEECPQFELSTIDDTYACPYCRVYLDYDDFCAKCPMSKAGNCCVDDSTDTYFVVANALGFSIVSNKRVIEKLEPLIEQYNNELKLKEKDEK